MQSQIKTHPIRTSVLTVVTVGFIVAAVLYYFLVLQDDNDASAQTGVQVEFEAERGDIVSSTSFDGTLVYAEKEELTFGGAGTVEDVMVSDGQVVSSGEELAKLDEVSLARLVAAVADAETELSQAKARYDRALSGSFGRSNQASAEAEQAQAEIALAEALERFSEIDGSDSSAVIEASQDLVDAREDLADAEQDLVVALLPDSNGLEDAVNTLDEATDEYADALTRWFAGPLSDELLELSLEEILDLWGVTLHELFNEIASEWDETPTPWIDDESTPWNEATIWSWTRLLPILVDTEATSASRSTVVVTPRVELNEAWDVLVVARKAHEAATEKANGAISLAEGEVEKASDAVEGAEDVLESLVDPATLRSRQAAVDQAHSQLDQANAALEEVESQNQVELKLAEAQLRISQESLSESEAALVTSTLTAPFDGVVTFVSVEPGDTVSPNQVVIEVVSSADLAVEANVDEEDILNVAIDAPAVITLDAIAGRTFSGYVSSIGQAVQSQQGAVTFPVLVTLENVGDLNLPEGLTASAEVISSQKLDVLRVPVAAVGGTFIQPTVDVIEDGSVTEIPVQIGISNGTFVEIVSGLNEGQTVQATITGSFGLDTEPQLPFGGGRGGAIAIPGGLQGIGGGQGRGGSITIDGR